jgi:hypothetical protein
MRRLQVLALEDRLAPATLTVTSAADTIAVDGVVTLREALTAASTNAVSGDAPAGDVGLDTIVFNIPVAGTPTISVTSALPTITEPLSLDGLTQPNGVGLPAVILNGEAAGVGTNGLTLLTHTGSSIRGLVIQGFGGAGLNLISGGGHRLTNNFIGTNANGTAVVANGIGILLSGSQNVTIGGSTSAARNVLSGNRGDGIQLEGDNNIVEGNRIGLDAVADTTAVPNGGNGITIRGTGNRIGNGGDLPGNFGNVVSGNTGDGIRVNGIGNRILGNRIGTNSTGLVAIPNSGDGVNVLAGSDQTVIGSLQGLGVNAISGNTGNGVRLSSNNNQVLGNTIGSSLNNTAALANGQNGILISGTGNTIAGGTLSTQIVAGNALAGISISGSGNLVTGNLIGRAGIPNTAAGVAIAGDNNTIGGTTTDASNTISNNGSAGIAVLTGTGNRLLGNVLSANGKLGIDLGTLGTTGNDVGDGDTGANNLQNFPLLSNAVNVGTTGTAGTSAQIGGSLNSTPNTQFRIEFFAVTSADPSGFGEGDEFLGAITATTDSTGNASFTYVSGPTLRTTFTATATNQTTGDTSEFSPARPLTPPVPPVPPAGVGANTLVVSGAGAVALSYTANSTGQLPSAGTSFTPFPSTSALTRGAAGDVNGDGVADTVFAAGPGGGDLVRIISGKDGTDLLTGGTFSAYAGEDFTTIGLFLAVGDIDGDGRAEVVVSPDQGGGARIQVFAFSGGSLLQRGNFFGIDDPAFRGGGRIALGDINADGKLDLVVGAGFGGGPRIALFNGLDLTGNVQSPRKLVGDFVIFEPGLRDGVFVAAGDLSGDGKADLVFGGGPGGGPRVTALNGASVLNSSDPNLTDVKNAPLSNFFAFDANQRGGVRVAVKEFDGDPRRDLVVGSGDDAPVGVKTYRGSAVLAAANGAEPTVLQSFAPFSESTLATGVFVG